MNIKIFCRCSMFPSWSGQGLFSTPVHQHKHVTADYYYYFVQL